MGQEGRLGFPRRGKEDVLGVPGGSSVGSQGVKGYVRGVPGGKRED